MQVNNMITQLKPYKVSAVLIVLGLVYWGCLDEISFPSLNDEQTAIVVEGSLRKGNPSVARITINRLFDFSAEGLKAVNLREAILLDDEGNEREMKEISPGTYETQIPIDDPVFKVEEGRSYRIQIATFDGREFITRPDPLMPVADAGVATVEQIEKDIVDEFGEFAKQDLFLFSVNAPIAIGPDGTAGRYRYFLEQTYKLTDSPLPSFFNQEPDEPKTCFVTEITDVTNVLVFDGNEFTGTPEVKIPLFEKLRNNTLFSEGYYLTVYQQSLSEDAYRYWNEISQVIERTGNMFEAPAGKIRSNFEPLDGNKKDEVFGYFYVTQEDTVRVPVSPEMADFPESFCPGPPTPPPPGERCLPRFPCCDCLLQPGSTLEQPEFWIE